jgi:hypothetical protein
MSYENLSIPLSNTPKGYIAAYWVHANNTNFFKKHIAARAGNLALTPWSFITNVADSIIGVGGGIACVVSAGLHAPTVRFARNHLSRTGTIVAQPYVNFLHTLNPTADFPIDPPPWVLNADKDRPLVSSEGNGLITHYVYGFLKGVAKDYRESENFFKKHIASRLTYALLLVSCVVTRVVDGIIGVIAAVFSCLFLGLVPPLNNLAYRGLQGTALIHDVFYCAMKILNPWASKSVYIILQDPA